MTESKQSHAPGNGDQVPSRSEKWGVVFLCHGSQRGTSPAECSCSWKNGTGDLPSWCRHCPSTPQGLGKAAKKLQCSQEVMDQLEAAKGEKFFKRSVEKAKHEPRDGSGATASKRSPGSQTGRSVFKT